MLRESGYQHRAAGGAVHDDAAEDKKLIDKELRGAKIEPRGRRKGGQVGGDEPLERPDRRARGGETGKKHAGKHKPGAVNIIVEAGGGGDDEKRAAAQQGLQAGAQLGARAAAAKLAGAGGPPGMPPGGPPRPPMPPGPPMGGPPMAGPPGGMPPRPMPPPGAGMMARGGEMRHRDERGRFLGGAV